MSDLNHLSKLAKEKLLLSDEERIYYIRSDRWVGYTSANQIIAKLEDLLIHPKINRMPNMLIVGDSNNGKSHIAEHFLSKHQAHDNPNGNGIKVPVLLVEAPSKGNVTHLHKRILNKLFVPFAKSTKDEDLEEQVISVLQKIDLGIIIIDEIHNLLTGSPKDQRQFLTSLKTLGNLVQVPIVGVGTEDAFRAFQTDPQMSNRYKVERLKKWKLDQDFLRFLVSLEKILPLKDASNLIQKDIATKIFAMTEGILGEISHLLNEAAVWAIKNSSEKKPECITREALDSCGYKSPSIRTSHKAY